ncbi:MAG: HAMP domain-containing histidine kinase [Clostridia bacterium]|nr:HAMP domain-containing histidine kinase [Clostridia bacterium]
MIARLKRKVIVLTAASLFALLVLIVSFMNIISYVTFINESDDMLKRLSESGGRLPEMPEDRDFMRDGKIEPPGDMPRFFLKDNEGDRQYFTVVLTKDNDIVRIDTGKHNSVTSDEAAEYAKTAVSANNEKGFIGNYRYMISSNDENRMIVMLDCTSKLVSFKNFLLSSIIVSFIGFIVVTAIIVIISGRIIRPIAESYTKQKRFITDASHELRTPLAIINANIDIIEDEVSDRESINDIRAQTERLKNLTEDLVTLSRMEEGGAAIVKEPFSASEAVGDILTGFKTLAEKSGARLTSAIEPDLTLNGDKKAFSKLVSIFLDNAIKYTPDGGSIEFSLSKQGKSVVVSCKNTTEGEMNAETTARVFDRFYRADASRNSASGGHGIGLSIAKAIVEAHGGKITASAPDEHTFFITASL